MILKIFFFNLKQSSFVKKSQSSYDTYPKDGGVESAETDQAFNRLSTATIEHQSTPNLFESE